MRTQPSLIIKSLKRNNLQVAVVASELGLSRSTIYRWLKKARSIKVPTLNSRVQRRSTRPKLIHRAISPVDQVRIINLRNQKGYTALKIRKSLGLTCSARTSERLLKRVGLIKKSGATKGQDIKRQPICI